MRRMITAGVSSSFAPASTRWRSRARKRAEGHARRQQCAGEEAALEVAPGVQHVLRVHADGARTAFRAAAHLPAGGVRGLHAIAAVQNLVRDVRGEVELQSRRVGLQGAVGVDDAGGLEERAHHAAHLAVLVPRQHRLAVEPADLKPVALAQAHQVIHRQREAPLADAVGGALQVREVVARHLLVGADQQVRELPPGGAGLRQQLRDRRLQQVLGEQERRLERNATAAPPGSAGERARGRHFRRGTRRPGAGTPPASSSSSSGEGVRLPLSIMLRYETDGARCGVALYAARRQLLEGQSVALAQRAQLGAEEMALAQQFAAYVARLRGPRPSCCEINSVKFL